MTSVTCVFAMELPVAASYSCQPHAHSCTELVLSDGSDGHIIRGDDAWPYSDGDLAVYQPGATHWVRNRRAGTHHCIGIIGCGADQLAMGVYPAGRDTTRHIAAIMAQARRHDPWRAN